MDTAWIPQVPNDFDCLTMVALMAVHWSRIELACTRDFLEVSMRRSAVRVLRRTGARRPRLHGRPSAQRRRRAGHRTLDPEPVPDRRRRRVRPRRLLCRHRGDHEPAVGGVTQRDRTPRLGDGPRTRRRRRSVRAPPPHRRRAGRVVPAPHARCDYRGALDGGRAGGKSDAAAPPDRTAAVAAPALLRTRGFTRSRLRRRTHRRDRRTGGRRRHRYRPCHRGRRKATR
jgi:hypothetical protein